MPNALLTGVSGLLAHQRLLEVVGHNIANVNTTGYKVQRAIFADLIYETIQPSTSSNQGNRGGTNPNQIGLGVKMAATDRKFSQGGLENTGEQFDLALQGDGFFVLTDGEREYYTRAGMFSRDSDGILVAPGGLRVKRFPGVGEPDGVNPAFQIPGDDTIRLPIGSSVPGVPTTKVDLTGNLSALLSEPVATVKTTKSPFTVPSGNATGASLLNDLEQNSVNYTTGDFINISGLDTTGAQVNFNMAVDATTTLQDVVTTINGLYTGVQASINNGNIVMTSGAVGPSDFKLAFRDLGGNTGRTSFVMQQMQDTVTGQFSDTYTTPVTFNDGRGTSRAVDLTFTKVSDTTWDLTASMSSADGTIVQNTIPSISFADDGTLATTGIPTMTFLFDGSPNPQTIEFNFESTETLEKLTHYGTGSNVKFSQNGSEPGELVSVSVESNGQVNGVVSNGQVFAIAQLAIATFRNPKGLLALGDSRFEQTLNSGEPEIGVAATGSRGTVQGGSLEGSNVDIAFEFTRLIVAQRGFAANARTITVSDEVLEELTNIIR